MLTTFITRHVRRYIEKNEETTMEEKVKQKRENRKEKGGYEITIVDALDGREKEKGKRKEK